MSSEKNNQTGVPKEKMRMAMISAVVTLLVIMAIGFTGFFFGKKQGTSDKTSVPVINLANGGTPKVLGAEEFSWSGIITKLDKSKITLKTDVKKSDGTFETKELVAIVGTSTELIKWDLTAPPATGQAAANRPKIDFKEFKTGQQIVVKSSNDLNDKNEVSATAIDLLLTPGNS